MLSRRAMLKLGAYTFAATRFRAFAAPSPGKRILILGGTGFLGPHVVERALERGHRVTLFNRGKTAADRFPAVEKFVGTGDRAKQRNCPR